MNNLLAYTAGYIDGDGCFYIGKNIKPVKYRNGIIVSSANKEILYFFQNQFSGRAYKSTENIRFKNYRPIYHWQVQGQNAKKLTQQLIPYLKEKRVDAINFIDFINEKSKSKKDILIKNTKLSRKNDNLVTAQTIEQLRKVEYIGVTSDEDYAYLAGFIDAECCLTISKYKPKNRPNYTYKILLQCNNTKTSIFYWLMEKFGGHCNFVSRKAKNSKHKDQIAWRLSSNILSKLLPIILPFLKHKRLVCEKLIEFYNTTQNNGGDRQSVKFKQTYTDILAKREFIVEQIHILNSKGLKNI